MKIGRGINNSAKVRPNQRINIEASDKNNNFSDLMQNKGREHSRELLKKLLGDIDDQGKKLIHSKNIRDLKIYKGLIKAFVDETIKVALSLENQHSFDRLGRSKRYKVIKELDEKLLELTNITLEKESKHLSILDNIGEIRGLLVNLYT